MAEGSDNTVFYIIGAVGLVAVGGVCCLAGGVGLAFMRARETVEAIPEPVVVNTEREAEPTGPLLPGHVSMTPPPSLNLNPEPTLDRRTRHIEATVTRADGSVGVSVGDRCSFDVLVLDRNGPPGHYCRTFAECNAVRLFGGDSPRRDGFFPCELYDLPLGVAGEDLEPTISYSSGDPIFQIDTRARRFVAIDNRYSRHYAPYRIEARIDTVTAR